MVRGRVDNRLSRAGGDVLPSMSSQVGAPPFLADVWSSPTPMLGGPMLGGPPLGFSGMMYPGQMPPFGMPTQYGSPISMPTTDPTWKTPELPSPFMRNALASGDITDSVKLKKARLSLSAAREQDAGDEDDVFLDVSRNEQGVERAVKQKILLPRPPPEKVPPKRKGKPPGIGRKNVEKAEGPGKHQRPAKLLAGSKVIEKKSSDDKTTTKSTRTPKGTLIPGPGTVAGVEGRRAISTPESADKNTEPHTPDMPVLTATANQDTERSLVKPNEPASPSLSPPVAAPESYSGVYINGSDGEEKFVLKPQNQTLRVEIPVTERFDAGSFRILSPEPSEVNSPPSHHETVLGGSNLQVASTDSEIRDMCSPKRDNKPQKASGEAFSRNFVDPAYAFSDDDEPALPRGKPQRKPSKPKPAKTTKTTNPEHGVLREISQNVGSGTVTPAQKPAVDEAIQTVGSTVVAPSQSPTQSLSLDHVVDRNRGGSSDSPEERTVPRRPVPITEISGMADNDKSSPSEGTYRRRMTRRKSMLGAGLPLIMEPDSRTPPANAELNASTETTEVVPSPTDKRSRLSKAQLQKTPARPTHRPDFRGRNSLKPPVRQEIPETSPSAQPAASPPTADGLAQTLEVLDSDPPFSSEEQIHALSNNLERAPSPTLTDPTSKPQSSPTLPSQPQPPSIPHTPVKAPNRRRSKSRPPTSSTTTKTATKLTAATTTKKKKSTGVLSLLPTNGANNDEDDDDDDELSILSPAKPSTATRTTPAGHHVRLGLWAPGLAGTKPASASASKLKRAVLAGTGTSLGQTTPSGRKGHRRRSAGPWTPSSSSAAARLLLEEELVQTPGGTMRRCGEGGFRCEREFCFSCL